MKILIAHHHRFELWNAPSWIADRIRAEFPGTQVVHLPGYEGITREIPDAEIFVGWSLRSEQVRAANKLRWIHSPAAAVHQLMIPELVNSDVIITNARDVHGPVVAEHAMALVLALAKRLPSALRFQHEKTWGQEPIWRESPRPRELLDATLLLLGLGSIGREIALRAKAFGMRVIAVREHPEKGSESTDGVFSVFELDRLLPQADFVLIAAPLTAATHKLFDKGRLATMRPGAYLINISRGSIIDEAALLEALGSKKIGGAALDVFAEEPLPNDSPFWSLENLLITPHTAALTERLWERHYGLIRENLQRYLSAQPLRNVVDKKKGY